MPDLLAKDQQIITSIKHCCTMMSFIFRLG